MPFTLVHPVAVLPLARGPLSLLALVAGSLAPDLPYFLRAASVPVTAESWYEPYVNATASHAFAELVSVTLPLALVVYVGGLLVIPPLRWVAGAGSRTAVERAPWALVRRGAWVAVSLVLGILTHLAWDALTEGGGVASRVLQHASTALGLAVLLVIAWRRRRAVAWGEPLVRRRLLAVAVACVVAALAGAGFASRSWLAASDELGTGQVLEGVLTDATKGGVAGVVAMAALLALLWWAARLVGGRLRPVRGVGR
ncbi:DUF4184 family protein [Mumia quercus]|uniref:DUF4184 family protein n=1 Tax=Mumia quercus TaxID=2976125 RepID=UPI0021CEEE1C|nr:DUF4184 family protein [Mumia quercus]